MKFARILPKPRHNSESILKLKKNNIKDKFEDNKWVIMCCN